MKWIEVGFCGYILDKTGIDLTVFKIGIAIGTGSAWAFALFCPDVGIILDTFLSLF